jgi:hypothetical protein
MSKDDYTSPHLDDEAPDLTPPLRWFLLPFVLALPCWAILGALVWWLWHS